MRFMPGADHVIAGDNHLMVIGKQEDAEKIVKHLTKMYKKDDESNG